MKPSYAVIVVLLALGGYVGATDYLDEQYLIQEKRKAEEKKAALFAALISQCFNGKPLTDGKRIIDCRIIKP